MKQITLTKEQEQQIEPTIQDWTKRARSIEEADWAAFETHARRCYELAKMPQPEHVVHVASPLILALAAPIAGYVWETDHQARRRKSSDYLAHKVWDFVDSEQVGQTESSTISCAVIDALGAEGQKSEALAIGALTDTKKAKEYMRNNWWACMAGQMWAGWHAYTDFVINVVKAELPDDLRDKAIATRGADMSAFWWWPHEKFIMVCDRPKGLHLDDQGRLHNPNEKAIEFRDGWGLYSVHGIRVPNWVYEQPEKLTPKAIDKEENAEIRRLMVERYGQAKYILDGGAKLVSEDTYGKLWQKELPGDHPMMMVEVVNPTPSPDGSYKTYFLDVSGKERELGWPIRTAHAAVAATWGKRAEDFHPFIRT